MPRYKEVSPVEAAQEDGLALAEKVATLHAELVKKKLPPAVIQSVLDKVGGAAASNSNGWCSPVATPGEAVSNPPR